MIKIDDTVQGIIFDLDGTLVDSMPVHKIAWQEICDTKGFDFTDEIFYKFAGVPSEQIFIHLNEQFGTDFDPKYHSDLKEEAFRKRIKQVKVIPEVFGVVKENHGRIPISIGTGSPRDHSLEVLRLTGLDRYFDILVSKEDVSRGKPAPDTFLRCAELMGVSPEDCLVFEDGDPGIVAAQTAGMRFIDVRPIFLSK